MKRKNSLSLIIMVIFFITGNLIGAGILGLPIKCGMAGLGPSLLATLVISFAMLVTSVILANESISAHKEVFHYPSLYEQYFGSWGKWIATIANLIILYGSLVVYITGATAVVMEILNIHLSRNLVILIFFAFVTAITLANPKALLKCNSLFVMLLLLSFAALVLMSRKYINTAHFSYREWKMLPAALPIIVMAAYFQNIIPTICRHLDWDRRQVFISIVSGSVIGFVMNTAWLWVGIGVLPVSGQDGILNALNNNLPATVPLARTITNPLFVPLSLFFALVAIITSYISMGNTTLDFIDDLTINYFKIKSRALTVLLAFAPPLIISIAYPGIFLNALDFVGGIGIVILFGIFPCVICFKRYCSFVRRFFFVIPALAMFAFVLFFKIQQEMGLSWLNPKAEYWTNFRLRSFQKR